MYHVPPSKMSDIALLCVHKDVKYSWNPITLQPLIPREGYFNEQVDIYLC